MSAVTPRKRTPPPRSARRNNELNVWTMLLTPLMTPRNTNEWFEVRKYDSQGAASSAAYDIRMKRNRLLPPGEWDATSRDGVLFVRYLGQTKGNQ